MSLAFAIKLLVGLAACSIGALWLVIRARIAEERSGRWNYLKPGTWFWLEVFIVLLLAVVGVFALDRGWIGLGWGVSLTSLAAGLVIFQAVQGIIERVRWDEQRLERRTLTGELRGLGWAEAVRAGRDWTTQHWVSAEGGPKLRFSDYDVGHAALLAQVRDHVPSENWEQDAPG